MDQPVKVSDSENVVYTVLLTETSVKFTKNENRYSGGAYQYIINLDQYLNDEQRKEIFKVMATDAGLKTLRSFVYTDCSNIDLIDLDFIEFLIENRIPKNIAYRLALIEHDPSVDRKEMFENFRKSRTKFYHDSKTGLTAFELYMKLSFAYSEAAAGNILSRRNDSFEEMKRLGNGLLSFRLHKDAADSLSRISLSGIEVLLEIQKMNRITNRTPSLVISRILADADAVKWSTASRIYEQMTKQLDFSDLVDPKEKDLAQNFYTSDLCNKIKILAGTYNFSSSAAIFSMLVSIYGIKMLEDAMEDLNEDKLQGTPTLASFIATAENIKSTGVRSIPADWILMMNGEVEFSSEDSAYV